VSARGRSLALVALAAAATMALVGSAQAATSECAGLQVCVPVAGPWVVVPVAASAQRPRVEFQLSCPRGHVVGGIDVEVSDQEIDVAFLGKSGSPVNPGVTTSRAAVFVASYVGTGGAAPTFRPHIGCMPVSGGGDRIPTARSVVSPVGTPTTRRVTEVRLRPASTRTVNRSCARREQIVGAAHAVGFFTAQPPPRTLVAAVSARRVVRAGRVAVVARTASLGGARVVLQVSAVCARGE
jgi:hypothetical protein